MMITPHAVYIKTEVRRTLHTDELSNLPSCLERGQKREGRDANGIKYQIISVFGNKQDAINFVTYLEMEGAYA